MAKKDGGVTIVVEQDLSKGIDKIGRLEEYALKQASRAIGGTAVGYAKAICPVKTGLLRNSITFAISGEEPNLKSYKADREDDKGIIRSGEYSGAMPKESHLCIYIGTNVKYAEAQENGDFQHHEGQEKHFLKKSATEHNEEYLEIIKKAFKASKID